MTARRLSSADRRAQLVGIARDVIATEGTDALTLAYLAEQGRDLQTRRLRSLLLALGASPLAV